MNVNFRGSNVLKGSGIRLLVPHVTVPALNLPRRPVRERISFFPPCMNYRTLPGRAFMGIRALGGILTSSTLTLSCPVLP